ncbi:MAG: hypothetical protein A2176_00215 [Spirochaetes bacterium RBG_13_51_14]|nr:MAG: hypothetical protein A2176_00215 [Spirochaetes bacterium RBG_13_51_14]
MAMKNRHKNWNIAILLASLVIPLLVIGINYFMDPLWCFAISHKYNQFQDPFNERIQKTNYLTFRDRKYHAVLIGTSRSTCINQYSFKGISVFNYSCNGLTLPEYAEYLKYAKKRSGNAIRHIFIGLDFRQTMGKFKVRPSIKPVDNVESTDPNLIISRANSPLYRLKSLLSVDTLKYSLRNYNYYRRGNSYYYTRDNVKIHTRYSRKVLDDIIAFYLDYFDKSVYPRYKYDETYVAALKKIRDENPDTTIIVYTTPESGPLMKIFIKHDLLEYYFRWLSDIVAVFGGCYHFMYPNIVTRNYHDYYHDAVHTNPEVGDMIADVIYNNKPHADLNFGIYIDKNNFASRKNYLKELFRKL